MTTLLSSREAHPDVDILTDGIDMATVVMHQQVVGVATNSDSQWSRDGQNMIEELPVPEDTATTVDSTVPIIPDDDQPMVAVTSEEEKYLVCDCAASRNNTAQGSTEVQDYQTFAELLLTARIGASLTVIGNGTIGLLGEVKVKKTH